MPSYRNARAGKIFIPLDHVGMVPGKGCIELSAAQVKTHAIQTLINNQYLVKVAPKSVKTAKGPLAPKGGRAD